MTINIKSKNKTGQELKSLLYVVLIALAIRFFVLELFFVPSESMKATILKYEYIFSTKYSYGYSKHSLPFNLNFFNGRIFASQPQRGDIVIFRPPHHMEVRYVKRLIGLPGDKLQLINDVVHINDQPVTRQAAGSYISKNGQQYLKYQETLTNGVSYLVYKNQPIDYTSYNSKSNTELFYIPSGQYFFLGDNRDDSLDSRFELGFVPFENFIAKAQFVLFSTEELLGLGHGTIIERLMRIGPWLSSIRFNRLFTNLYTVKPLSTN